MDAPQESQANSGIQIHFEESSGLQVQQGAAAAVVVVGGALVKKSCCSSMLPAVPYDHATSSLLNDGLKQGTRQWNVGIGVA